MLEVPHKSSLVEQTAGIIRSEIEKGQWKGWLPSERSLSGLLRISRPTLRLALGQLCDAKLIRPKHGLGYEVVMEPKPRLRRRPLHDVHLLSPDSLEQMRHRSHLWIDELRDLLHQSGHELRIHHGMQYLRKGVERALQRLTVQNPDGCWVLAHSTSAIQQWFARQELPSMVAGHRHAGAQLPFVSIDVEAACRHAVGVLTGLGHRDIILLQMKTDRAGDALSVRGFLEGARRASDPDIRAKVVYYAANDPETIGRALKRLLRERPAPTALLVDQAVTYATAATLLPPYGWRIPEDISLISREEESFLGNLIPRPAYYSFPPERFALRIYEQTRRLLAGETAAAAGNGITPDYLAGGSVAAPRVR